MLGVIQMSGKQVPAIASILKRHGLEYLPEMHCYLMANGARYDFTGPESPITPRYKFLYEEKIEPEQVESYKTELHKKYLAGWLAESGLNDRFDLETFWRLREECIAARSD